MGLHREDSLKSFSVFDQEIRRRLWWQIIFLDARAAQLSGIAIDPASYLSWDTKRPLNLNDSDLCPSMQGLPAESEGPTEMLFCGIRFEVGACMRQLKAMENHSSRTASATRMDEEGRAIDTLEKLLEVDYLQKCDPSRPFHLLAMYLGRSSICQMRLATYHPQRRPDKGASLTQDEKDRLFSLGCQIIAYDNLAHSNKRLQPYLWHVAVTFPFEAFILILTELLARFEGDLVERAWTKVNQVYEDHPDLITASKTNALFFALGSLTIRAWDERVKATFNQHPLYQPVEPRAIAKIRAARATSHDDHQTHTALAIQPAIPFVTGYPTTEDMGTLSEAVDDSMSIAMDMSHIDWQYWQTLINEQGNDFQ